MTEKNPIPRMKGQFSEKLVINFAVSLKYDIIGEKSESRDEGKFQVGIMLT